MPFDWRVLENTACTNCIQRKEKVLTLSIGRHHFVALCLGCLRAALKMLVGPPPPREKEIQATQYEYVMYCTGCGGYLTPGDPYECPHGNPEGPKP